jgi:hypothetical protein
MVVVNQGGLPTPKSDAQWNSLPTLLHDSSTSFELLYDEDLERLYLVSCERALPKQLGVAAPF